jgi:hypothetical protein
MPNPTLFKKDGAEYVVFTDTSFQQEGPNISINFFNLDSMNVEWEIPGGEIFVDFTKGKGVTFITREVRMKQSKSTALNKKKADTLEDARRQVNIVKWGD